MAKVLIYLTLDREKISYMYSLGRSNVGRIIEYYLEKWAKVGEYLYILPILEDYLKMEINAKYCDFGHNRVPSLDAKERMIERIRISNNLVRQTHRNKMK